LIELIVYKHGNICIDGLATPLMAVHFDDESWRGGGYAFLAELASRCMVSISFVWFLYLL
jgi:hypothetical protein